MALAESSSSKLVKGCNRYITNSKGKDRREKRYFRKWYIMTIIINYRMKIIYNNLNLLNKSSLSKLKIMMITHRKKLLLIIQIISSNNNNNTSSSNSKHPIIYNNKMVLSNNSLNNNNKLMKNNKRMMNIKCKIRQKYLKV